MDKLLIYDARQIPFDLDEVKFALNGIRAASNIRSGPNVIAAVEANYDANDEDAIIRLISTKKLIALEGTYGAILSSAMDLKAALSVQLRIIDEQYTFDISLEEIRSADELATAIESAIC